MIAEAVKFMGTVWIGLGVALVIEGYEAYWLGPRMFPTPSARQLWRGGTVLIVAGILVYIGGLVL